MSIFRAWPLAAALILANCASHDTVVRWPAGMTQAQRDQVAQECAGQAKAAGSNPDRIAAAALVSATVIGAPLAIDNALSFSQAALIRCLQERGYTAFAKPDGYVLNR
jgi:hypothetical protein